MRAVAFVVALVLPGAAFGQAAKKVDVTECVGRGLEFLKKKQWADGHWEAARGQYPTVCTALAGLAFLMEGSNLREGKYSDQIARAVDWFLVKSQANGLLGTPQNPTESSRYMYGHGYGLLFLASAYGEEADVARRKAMEKLLRKAVTFTVEAQTRQGGWGYVTAAAGGGFDEGHVLVIQLQGLCAARNAGIPVPKACVGKAMEYFRKSTTVRGGIVYHLGAAGPPPAEGGERPAVTAGGVVSAFCSGLGDEKTLAAWVRYCREAIWNDGRVAPAGGHDDFQTYYFAQVVFALGEDRYGEIVPNDPKGKWVVWSKYRDNLYRYLRESQAADGGWAGGFDGDGLIVTSFRLHLLQLENNLLPPYHR